MVKQKIVIHSLGYADNLPDTAKKVTWKQFKDMVNNHDLTYVYSDDYRWYRAGTKSFDAIRQAALQFSRARVTKVWNDMVDRNLVENARAGFYWSDAWKCKGDK